MSGDAKKKCLDDLIMVDTSSGHSLGCSMTADIVAMMNA